MSKWKLFGLFMAVVFIFLFTWCSGGRGTYTGNNWQVTVHHVRYETNFGIAPNQYDGLVIDVSVEYIGPDGEVPAPAIYLEKGAEKELRATLVQTHKNDPASDLIIRAWLGDKGTKFNMKKGDTLSKVPFSLLWSMPEKRGSFKLLIGDVPPISIYLL
jgi:hypothetical protein